MYKLRTQANNVVYKEKKWMLIVHSVLENTLVNTQTSKQNLKIILKI